jgi:hypothetical protein
MIQYPVVCLSSRTIFFTEIRESDNIVCALLQRTPPKNRSMMKSNRCIFLSLCIRHRNVLFYKFSDCQIFQIPVFI